MELKIGQTMRDLTTNFTGIAINRTTTLNGTVQYNLQPQSKDGNYPEAISIDENLLEFVDVGVSEKATPSTFSSPIVLGNQVEDIITKTSGIATIRTDYLNGCTQFQVEYKSISGKYEGEYLLTWLDQARLKVVGEGITNQIVKPPKAANGKQPGGPVMRGIPRG